MYRGSGVLGRPHQTSGEAQGLNSACAGIQPPSCECSSADATLDITGIEQFDRSTSPLPLAGTGMQCRQ
ncbi:hypothetical protein CS8_024160 [Cupriavidus sp. 8B]